jgi:hypothetical protein
VIVQISATPMSSEDGSELASELLEVVARETPPASDAPDLDGRVEAPPTPTDAADLDGHDEAPPTPTDAADLDGHDEAPPTRTPLPAEQGGDGDRPQPGGPETAPRTR